MGDGSFLLAKETKRTLLPGIFPAANNKEGKQAEVTASMDLRIDELVEEAKEQTKDFAASDSEVVITGNKT